MRCTLGLDIHQRFDLSLLLWETKSEKSKAICFLWLLLGTGVHFYAGEGKDDHLGFFCCLSVFLLLRPELESFEIFEPTALCIGYS